jgi:hypothetical protein
MQSSDRDKLNVSKESLEDVIKSLEQLARTKNDFMKGGASQLKTLQSRKLHAVAGKVDQFIDHAKVG